MGVRSDLAEKKRKSFLQKLGTFPPDYIEIEKNSLTEGWEKVVQLVDDKYKSLVEKNSRKAVGKSYKDNAIMELNINKERMKRRRNV